MPLPVLHHAALLCILLLAAPAIAGPATASRAGDSGRTSARKDKTTTFRGRVSRRAKAVRQTLSGKIKAGKHSVAGRALSFTTLARKSPQWLRSTALSFEGAPSLQFGDKQRVSSWRDPQRLDRAAENAIANGDSVAFTRAALERAVTVRTLWDRRGLYSEFSRSWRRDKSIGKKKRSKKRTDPRIRKALARELERGPIFVTGDRGGHRDARVLRPVAELHSDSKFLISTLRHEPQLKGPIGLPGLKKTIDAALSFVGDRAVYTRGGAHGIFDLLNDPVVAKGIGLSPEKQVKALAAIASATRTVALDRVPPAARIGKRRKHARSLGGKREGPLELQHLLAHKPGLQKDLAALQAKNIELRMHTVKRTPNHVLEAIARVAVVSQENFLQTWLPQLIEDGATPNLKPTKMGITRGQAMKPPLIAKDLSKAAISKILRRDIETIRDSVQGGYVKLVADRRLTAAQSKKLARLNRALKPLGRRLARRRMLFDNADERTHEAQEVVKKMPLIGMAAHGVQLAGFGEYAHVVAGSTDDLVGEYAEIKALLGSGFAKQELYKRLKVLIPVFGLATYGATQVHGLLESGHEIAGGAVFGLSAVALSLVTAIQSIGMYRQSYGELVDSGKVPGKVGVLMREQGFQKNLLALEKDSRRLLEIDHRPELIKLVRKSLQEVRSRDPKALSKKEMEVILKDLARVDLKAMVERTRNPTKLQRWKAALKQDFSNPARLGLLLGASAAPFVGMLAAKAGTLNNAYVMAAVGSTEGIVAAATVTAAGAINEYKYKRTLSKEIARADKKSGAAR